MAFKDVLLVGEIFDNETCQLLAAAPFNFGEEDEHQKILFGDDFICGKLAPEQENALASPSVDKLGAANSTPKLGEGRTGKSS